MSFALLGAEWVLWLLVALSVGCIAVSLERALYLGRDGTPRAPLRHAVDAFLRSGDGPALAAGLARMAGFESRVLGAGLEVAPTGVEAAERAMAGTVAGERLRMERGLAFLATVGANAPFVGLFGTVLGIIKAFHDLASNTTDASEAVMAGISEALVATAVGLMVAIPAVILYNLFLRWVKSRVSRVESLGNLVLARLGGHASASAVRRPDPAGRVPSASAHGA